MTNEQELLRQCIASGQVDAAQVEVHRAAGDLDDDDSISLVRPRDRRFWPMRAEPSGLTPYNTFVQEKLTAVAKELGISVEELRAQEGKVHHLKNGTSFVLVTRQMAELKRAENAAFREMLHRSLLDDFYNKLGQGHVDNIMGPGLSFDEVTIPREQRKTCLSCGRKQEPDGTLLCGH